MHSTVHAQVGEFVKQKMPMDLGIWLRYHAFDVVGEFSLTQKLGFLDQGKDLDDMMEGVCPIQPLI